MRTLRGFECKLCGHKISFAGSHFRHRHPEINLKDYYQMFPRQDGKYCVKCKRMLPISDFHKSSQANKEYAYSCKDCESERAIYKNYKLRKEILQKVSGQKVPRCKCCGENCYLFLTLDHIDGINPNNRLLRRTFFLRIKRNEVPITDLQVLCFNCNCVKRNYFSCPHQFLREGCTPEEAMLKLIKEKRKNK